MRSTTPWHRLPHGVKVQDVSSSTAKTATSTSSAPPLLSNVITTGQGTVHVGWILLPGRAR
jgi:hypothetical protein